MSWAQVSNCPKCGALIYIPMDWNSVLPPPSKYTCSCNPQPKIITTVNTN